MPTPKFGEGAGVGGLETGRDAEGADADDETLAGHQPGHRLDGAERARIGQGHRGAGEVVGGDLVGVDLAHQLLVGADEARGSPGASASVMHGTSRVRLPSAFSTSTARPEPHVLVPDDPGGPLAVGVGDEGGVHGRHGDEPLDHGVADQMGEADLAAGGPEELVVDDGAVDLEQLGRHHPHAGGGGDAQRRLHVGHDAAGRTPQGHGRLRLSVVPAHRAGTGAGRPAAGAVGCRRRRRSGRRPQPTARRRGARPGGGGRPVTNRPAGSRRRTRCHDSDTEVGSVRYRSYMSSTNQALGPNAPVPSAPAPVRRPAA